MNRWRWSEKKEKASHTVLGGSRQEVNMVEVGRTKEREWRKNGRERCEEMAMKEE